MEREGSWEQNALMNELIEGMEIARKLKAELSLLPSSVDTSDLLVQRMLSCYDKALLILKWKPSVSKSQTQTTKHQSVKHHSKKRKMKPKWIDRVRLKTENGIEGPHEDGYNWRKYGKKEILSAKYPRSYYRCTFRKTKGCWATKQIQRSDEDPTILDITYRGEHTCSQGNNSLLPPKSSDTQEIISMGNIEETASYPFTSFGCMAAQDNNTLLSSLSQMQLLSPQTPESNHFPSFSSSSSFVTDELNHHGIGVSTKPCPDSDTTDFISAKTSPTDSPIFDFNFDFNFSLDALKIDSDFHFNVSGGFIS